MRKNAFLAPALILIAGAVCLFIRSVELRTVFDEVTGLTERGARVSMLLIAVACAVVLISLAFSIISGIRYKSPRGFENAFGPLGVSYVLSFSALGFIWLAASAYELFSALSVQSPTIAEIYFSCLSVVSALSVILFSVWMYKEPSKNAKLFFCVIPPLFLCFWLVALYRENSSNPVLLSFCYECLAIIASAMAYYFTAGYVYGRPAPGRAIFSYLTAAFFCIIVLADNISVSRKVVFAVMAITHLIYTSLLIGRLKHKNESGSISEKG